MTKTQKTNHENHLVRNTPLNATRYTGFYLTMLILSTVGTAFGLFGLLGIPEAVRYFNISPVYTILSLINVAIVLPVAIWALVLLWLKRPLGIWLKLGTYAVSILSTIAILFTAGPVLKDVTNQALEEAKKSSDKIDASFIETVSGIAFYIGVGFSIIIAITFGLLWWFAWKKQKDVDAE